MIQIQPYSGSNFLYLHKDLPLGYPRAGPWNRQQVGKSSEHQVSEKSCKGVSLVVVHEEPHVVTCTLKCVKIKYCLASDVL